MIETAKELFLGTVAGSVSLSLAKWPGGYTVTNGLPKAAAGGMTTLKEGGSVVGGVFTPGASWTSVLLDFAAAGNADLNLTVEIGKIAADACMPQVLSSVVLKSGPAYTANFNPFTGAPVAATTFRIFDLITPTNRGQMGQLMTSINGTDDNTPSQMLLGVTISPYYYVLLRNLGGLTGPVSCCITPQP